MPFVRIERGALGAWCVRVVCDEDVQDLEGRGEAVAHVDGGVLEAWYRHRDEAASWHALWGALEQTGAELSERRSKYDVVIDVAGIGEVRRGPYTWDEAIKERDRVAQRSRARAASVRPATARARTGPVVAQTDAEDEDSTVEDDPDRPSVPRTKTKN